LNGVFKRSNPNHFSVFEVATFFNRDAVADTDSEVISDDSVHANYRFVDNTVAEHGADCRFGVLAQLEKYLMDILIKNQIGHKIKLVLVALTKSTAMLAVLYF
jgi:hypothetical protein